MTPLEEAHTAHQEAMELAEGAFLAERRGNVDLAAALYSSALSRESDAAQALAGYPDIEPTRSVLYRSAATLAMRCGRPRDAERLAAQGLAGTPPEEIADELRAVIDEAGFARHLRLNGLILAPGGVQLSLWGDAVRKGEIVGSEFLGRFHDIERLLMRTAERKSGRPFQDRITAAQGFRKKFEIFMSIPRPASFAVTVSMGVSEQAVIPGLEDMQPSAVVMDELLACLRLFNEREDKNLRERISDATYYSNFMALAKRIAPDGERIRGVGFTTLNHGEERSVGLTRKRTEVPYVEPPESPRRELSSGKRVSIVGTLRFADALSDTEVIQVLDPEGKKHRISVPDGIMSDIVRPLWDQLVVVTGVRRGRTLFLEEIVPVE